MMFGVTDGKIQRIILKIRLSPFRHQNRRHLSAGFLPVQLCKQSASCFMPLSRFYGSISQHSPTPFSIYYTDILPKSKFIFIALSFRCVVGTGVLDGPLPQYVFADRPGGRSLQGLYDKLEFEDCISGLFMLK